MVPSLLAKAGALSQEPFPHLVIQNALPDEYYWELYRALPPPIQQQLKSSQITSPNFRIDDFHDIALPPIWLDFFAYHRSAEFLAEVGHVFGLDTAGRRVEAQLSENAPSPDSKAYVLGAHKDGEMIFFSAMLYMGDPTDGGDLQLCRWFGKREWVRGNRCELNASEPVKTIPYGHNVFVGFVNSMDAIHQVSPRQSPDYRRFVSLMVIEEGATRNVHQNAKASPPKFR